MSPRCIRSVRRCRLGLAIVGRNSNGVLDTDHHAIQRRHLKAPFRDRRHTIRLGDVDRRHLNDHSPDEFNALFELAGKRPDLDHVLVMIEGEMGDSAHDNKADGFEEKSNQIGRVNCSTSTRDNKKPARRWLNHFGRVVCP
jgi:hypothetical protein